MKLIEIFSNSGKCGNLGVLGAGGIEPIPGLFFIKKVALSLSFFQRLTGAPEYTLMCAEGLVGAVGIKIHAKRFHIRNNMRRIGHSVRHHQRANAMGHLDNLCHIVMGANDVGTQGCADDPCLVCDQCVEIIQVQFTISLAHPPFSDNDSVFRQTPPAPDVRFVILIGHHDLIADA